jgi:hypothetical protein
MRISTIAVLFVAACSFHPNYGGNGEFQCGAGGICPAGQMCAADNHCYDPNHLPPDASVNNQPDTGTPGPDAAAGMYAVHVSVTSLAGTGLQVQLNAGETITIDEAAGTGDFTTKLAYGAAVAVRIAAQPQHLSQICTLGSFPSTVSGADVNVPITCSTNSFSVGGLVNGLTASGLMVTDGSTTTTLNATATSYQFLELDGTSYDIEIAGQPTGETCVITKNMGKLDGASVNDATITCGTTLYGLGGTISGLTGAGLMITDGIDTASPLTGDTTFSFPTKLPDGATYQITVSAQPAGESCSVSGGGPATLSGPVSVSVLCASVPYKLGGQVTGYIGSGLQLTQGSDTVTVDSTGAFQFPTGIVPGATYDVIVATDPEGPAQHCVVTNPTGTMPGNDVTTISVTCANRVTPRYTLGANWNDLIVFDGVNDTTNQNGTPCNTQSEVTAADCLQGGVIRQLVVSGVTSCAGITATDALGAFTWQCDLDSGATDVVVVSSGFTDQTFGLASLIDFSTGAFKLDTVTVMNGTATVMTSATTAWWTNPITLITGGVTGTTPSGVYALASNATGAVRLAADKESFVAGAGATLAGTVVGASGSKFLWIEGAVTDASPTDVAAVELDATASRLRNVVASGAMAAVQITGSLPFMSGVVTSGSPIGISLRMVIGAVANNTTTSGHATYDVDWYKGSNSTINTITGDGTIRLNTVMTGTLTGADVASILVDGAANCTVKNSNLLHGALTLNAALANQFDNMEIVPATTTTYGVVVDAASMNNQFYTTSIANGGGFHVTNSSTGTLISSATITDSGTHGILIDGASKGTKIVDTLVANVSSDGIHCLGSPDLLIIDTTVASAGKKGIYTTCSNTLLMQTAVYHSANDDAYELDTGADNSQIYGAAATDDNVGFRVVAKNLIVGGKIVVGGNSNKDCVVTGTNDQIADMTCSTPNTMTGQTMSASFVGPITVDDTTNAVDNLGAAPYDSILTDDDWTTFQQAKRGWGPDATTTLGSISTCRTGQSCRIFDWQLLNADVVIHKLFLKLLDGKAVNTLTHTLSDGTVLTFMKNAREEMGDVMSNPTKGGNENGLCESNETCVFAPNLGAYQGHGPKASAGTWIDGVVVGVDLQAFSTNGR